MLKGKILNQKNPPRPKKARGDSQGNDRRRLYAKSGNATIRIASNLTQNACEVLEAHILGCIENLGGKSECSFIITQ